MLCQWHHTAVHEGGVIITEQSCGRVFTKPDGQSCDSWGSDENLPGISTSPAAALKSMRSIKDQLAAVDSFQHPDARTIQARWTGEPFDLHACVQALFTIKLPKPRGDQDQQA